MVSDGKREKILSYSRIFSSFCWGGPPVVHVLQGKVGWSDARTEGRAMVPRCGEHHDQKTGGSLAQPVHLIGV